MKLFDEKGNEVIQIVHFASLLHLSLPTIRNCLTRDNTETVRQHPKRRPMKHIRDGNSIWISALEITGYPFIKGDNVWHYTEEGERVLCEQCTYGIEPCEANLRAQAVEF